MAARRGLCGGNRFPNYEGSPRFGLRRRSELGQKPAPAVTVWNRQNRLFAYALGAYEMGGFTQ